MEYWFRCPDPEDKEAWRQWAKCHAWCCVVVLAVLGVILILWRL